MDVQIPLGDWSLIVVESLIEALDQLEDPDPIVRGVLATWKTQVLLETRRAETGQAIRNTKMVRSNPDNWPLPNAIASR